jgi:hypothetical protein
MWTPENITALSAALVALVGALASGAAVIIHAADPGAHDGQGHPTGGGPPAS